MKAAVCREFGKPLVIEEVTLAKPQASEMRVKISATAIRERLKREQDVLASKKISAYFLIVWDFVSWARQEGIPATARGTLQFNLCLKLFY